MRWLEHGLRPLAIGENCRERTILAAALLAIGLHGGIVVALVISRERVATSVTSTTRASQSAGAKQSEAFVELSALDVAPDVERRHEMAPTASTPEPLRNRGGASSGPVRSLTTASAEHAPGHPDSHAESPLEKGADDVPSEQAANPHGAVSASASPSNSFTFVTPPSVLHTTTTLLRIPGGLASSPSAETPATGISGGFAGGKSVTASNGTGDARGIEGDGDVAAATNHRVDRALREPGRARELGLGPEGPVLAALVKATHASRAPVDGRVRFVATANAAGEVVAIEVSDCDGNREAWSSAATDAINALRGKKLRLPPRTAPSPSATVALKMTIEVTSAWTMPDGSAPTASPAAKVLAILTLDRPASGAKPVRVVHTRLIDSLVL